MSQDTGFSHLRMFSSSSFGSIVCVDSYPLSFLVVLGIRVIGDWELEIIGLREYANVTKEQAKYMRCEITRLRKTSYNE